MTKSLQYVVLVGLVGGSLIAARSAIAQVFTLLPRDEYSHIVLIIPIVCALLWMDRKLITPVFTPAIGVGVLALAAVLAALCRYDAMLEPDLRLALEIAALVTWWIGCFVLFFGATAFRRELFPLAFLYFLVPWPDFVLDIVIPWLQHESASSAKALFGLFGTPISLDGISLLLPGLTLNVAPECSSIRSSMMLLITTLVFGHLFLHSIWRKMVLALAAILLSPLKNGLRIFIIGSMALRNPAALSGWLHVHGGVVFLAIAQGIVFLLLWFLRKGETTQLANSAY